MKFVLFLLIVLSFFAALYTYAVAGVTWNYFPSSAVGVAFYEYSDWLIALHSVTGVALIFLAPRTGNKKLMVAAIGIVLASILVNYGSTHLKTEKRDDRPN